MTIGPFKGEHRWLSNFWGATIRYENRLFDTTEHLYQSSKTLDPVLSMAIAEARTPGDAKRAGSLITIRDDWDTDKVPAMSLATLLKFTQHPELALDLLNTGDEDLVEFNEWHDNFWGDCTCEACSGIVGENHLGKILMETRDIIRRFY